MKSDELRKAIRKALDLLARAEAEADWNGYAKLVDEARDILREVME